MNLSPSEALQAYLSPVFQKWDVSLSPTTYVSDNTQDFQTEIVELLVCNQVQTRTQNAAFSKLAKKPIWEGFSLVHTIQNIQELAKKLGLSLQIGDKFYLIRDHFIRLPNGEFRTQKRSQKLEDAIKRVHSGNLYLDLTASTRTKNQIFNGWIGKASAFVPSVLRDWGKYIHSPIQAFEHSNLEGGNIWILTNQRGQIQALVGQDQLSLTLNALLLENHPWEAFYPFFIEYKNNLRSSLSDTQIKSAAEEMYATGFLQQNGCSGLIKDDDQLLIMTKKFYEGAAPLSEKERHWFRDSAVSLGLINPFQWNDSIQKETTEQVVDYLTKKAIVHELIAKDLQIDPKNLHFISQANYHLDTFCRPGPHQSMFIVNYAFSAELLEAMQIHAEHLGLSQYDQELLKQYIETAKKFDIELGPLLAQATQQVEDAGFIAIPTPGSFIYEHPTLYQEFPMPSEGFNGNFMNSIAGWSSKAQKFYLIAQGMKVGDTLGNRLMEVYAAFMKRYVDPIDLFFVGEDQADFTESMDLWNRLDTQSGIHCFSVELKTKSVFP